MPTQFAVDTNFLMDCAHPKDVAHDAREVIRRRVAGAQILITPTAFDELVHKATNAPDLKTRKLANAALRGMEGWGVIPVELSDLQIIFARNIARKLLDQSIIPADERNDALILAEAAVLGCQLLISSDSDLCDANQGRLALALQACGVSVVLVFSPAKIVREFAGRR